MNEQLYLDEQELTSFCDVVASFHTVRDMDELLLTVLAKIKSLFAIEGASIALHKPQTREFQFIRTVEGADAAGTGSSMPRFPDHEGIAGWVMVHKQPVLTNAAPDDRRFFAGLDREGQFTTRSMICVPLQTRKGFIGVLYALNKQEGRFTVREQKILEILAGTVAVSLENAQLYGELKDHVSALEREKQALHSQLIAGSGFETIIGTSAPMRRMFDLMHKVIATPTTVLIQGETGTGKELIARVIHANGPFSERPFVAENCGALPENLLESELFGHVKGAFTGAIANKKGLFEIADGGTIFLDEIGEMSMPMQVKLLRVLQEGQFRPVGGSQVRSVNVRVIASTNRDLAEEVRRGTFRDDLYFRINVFQITPPPLRERLEDIPGLAAHFLKKYADRAGRPAPCLSPSALDPMYRFHWPGNVRELENEMERALTMAGGDAVISEEMLSDKLRCLRRPAEAAAVSQSAGSLKSAVRDLERRMILEALEACGSNRSRVAKKLGLSRQGLLNKMSAYSLHERGSSPGST